MNNTKKLTLCALFLALGLILPFFTGQIPEIGNMLLPMHLPVLICGFICGWKYGLILGFITPLFRMMIFGMPPLPKAMGMAFELAVYGAVTGFLYERLPSFKGKNYVCLLSAMLLGRIVWGIVSIFIYGMNDMPFGLQIFIAEAFINAIPGIILQIVLIPLLILALEKSGVLKKND